MVAAGFHRLTVTEVQRETDDAVCVRFEVPDALRATFAFTQGQYLTLRETIAGEDVRRSYSICSGVDDEALRVAIKHIEGGRFSSYANDALKVGDVLEVCRPRGASVSSSRPTTTRIICVSPPAAASRPSSR